MSELILHQYPESPYAEKGRLAMGFKGLSWRAVPVPMIMPKPDLMPLTGGYRRTPVMQIGADVYCDTLCIFRELDRLHPEPSFFLPGTEAAACAVAFWAEQRLFKSAVGIVFSGLGDRVPQAMREDRAKFLGRDFDPAIMHEQRFRIRDHARVNLSWLEGMLSDGRRFLFGDRPCYADLSAYHPIWLLLRNRRISKPYLDPLPAVLGWAERIAAIGHGTTTPMEPREALEIARTATPCVEERVDPDDPLERRPGDRVQVVPDDMGFDPVQGEIVASSINEIIIRRHDDQVGDVMVHFPREGFVVTPA